MTWCMTGYIIECMAAYARACDRVCYGVYDRLYAGACHGVYDGIWWAVWLSVWQSIWWDVWQSVWRCMTVHMMGCMTEHLTVYDRVYDRAFDVVWQGVWQRMTEHIHIHLALSNVYHQAMFSAQVPIFVIFYSLRQIGAGGCSSKKLPMIYDSEDINKTTRRGFKGFRQPNGAEREKLADGQRERVVCAINAAVILPPARSWVMCDGVFSIGAQLRQILAKVSADHSGLLWRSLTHLALTAPPSSHRHPQLHPARYIIHLLSSDCLNCMLIF